MFDKKFDFVKFWENYKEPPKEKIEWLKLPVYLLGWIAFKSLFILPFVLGIWIAGKNLYGAMLGLVFFAVTWFLFYLIFDRKSS